MKFALRAAVVCFGVGLAVGGAVNAADDAAIASASEALPAGAIGVTLEDFFTAAMRNSPRLQIAEESMKIGESRRKAASGRLLPQLNASANVSDNRQTRLNTLQTFDGNRYSLQLSQVLFNWQAFSQRKQALIIEDQTEAEYYNTLSELLTEVAEKYFDVLAARDAVESVASELEAITNQLAQIQSMYDRQLAQITDLYRAQAELANVESRQLMLQSRLIFAEEALRSATGIDIGSLYQLNETVDIPPLDQDVDYFVQQARMNSHVIRARELAFDAAREHVSESRGAYMPRVSLIVQQQNTNVGYDNAPLDTTDSNYIGLDITIPLFAGGSNRASVAEASSRSHIAANELQLTRLDVKERVTSAYLQVESTARHTLAARKVAESTALSAEAMQQGFELGAVTSVEVLEALRDQFDAERDLQQSRYEHIKYLLQLKRDTGTLTAEDLLEVGSWLTPLAN
jgi:outer membrane protein